MNEKQNALEEKMDEQWGCAKLTVEQCRTCVFAKGPAPFADAPDKAFCLKYPHPYVKPDSVLFDGEECEYHMTEAEQEATRKRLEEKWKALIEKEKEEGSR